ncbi:MAG: class I SAM-dependent methyltransferase [Proteobacteria bacterium]|nr:MAG: class I SAM-dependent methyltransferase [Pseudomonadota bacterium]
MAATSGGYGSHPLLAKIRNPRLRRLARMVYPPMPTLNVIPSAVLNGIREALFRPGSMVLNIGSGGLSGCGRRLWTQPGALRCHVIHMDLSGGEPVNLRGDAHVLPFSDGSLDAVIMQAVLEHLAEPRTALTEVWRVLRPGGILYVEIPFLQGFHADPHDYQRYTLPGLRRRLAGFEELASGVSVGPFCTLVWVLRDGLSNCFRNRVMYTFSRALAGWMLSPVRYLDYLARYSPAAERLANEYYYLCRKPLP